MNILARCGLTLGATLFALCSSAETKTYTLSAQTVCDAFISQLPAADLDITSHIITINDGNIKWALTLTAPDDKTFNGATFKGYIDVLSDGFFTQHNSDGTTEHIGAFSLSSDSFSGAKINKVTLTAGIYSGDPIGATKSTYTFCTDKNTLSEESENVITTRSKIKPVSFDVSEAINGNISVGATMSFGGRFAFKELTIEYESESATANPVKIDEVPVGHIVNLGCDDADAKIYYAFDGASEWKEYDAENPVVLAETGSHTLSYYAKAPDKVQSETATETFNVVQPTGLEYAVAMSAAPITVSGIVVRHDESKGYTLVGPSATSPEDDCLALDNSDCNALRTAEAGSTVRATGRLTDRFGVAALGSLSAVAIDGNNSEITTATSAVSNAKGMPIREFDLRGRDITGAARTARPQIVVNSAGKKYIR